MMKIDDLEFINYISNINRINGKLQGTLEACLWWDIPSELKEKIKNVIKKVEEDYPEFPKLEDEKK